MNEQTIFFAALELVDGAKRRDYLDNACAGDEALRQQVESLLAAHERAGNFLDQPVLRQLGGQTMTAEHAAVGDEIDLSFLEPSTKADSLGRLAHYEVQAIIGRGGYGIVLKAFDEKLHRMVAIKVMAPELSGTSPARKRFLREARAAAAVRHEHVVSIHAVEDVPVPFLVMEYIDGETLQQRLDQTGPLDLHQLVRIGQQIASGLAAAHAIGLLHRDIKPANVLLERGKERVKITDFGLARAADDASLTQSGMIAGTPLYMSPEQARGDTIDQRSDLFSLGSVLYVMCSGRPPFRAATTLAVLKRVADDQPRPINEIIPEVPAWLVAIISKLHAKSPAERFSAAEEVADLLTRCLWELQQQGHVEALAGVAGLLAEPVAISAARIAPAPTPASSAPTMNVVERRWGLITAAIVSVLVMVLCVAEAAGVLNVRGTIARWLNDASALQTSAIPSNAVQPSKEAIGETTQVPQPAIAPFNTAAAKQYQSAWAKHLGLPVEHVNSLGIKFRLIPPGESTMGNSPEEVEEMLSTANGDEYWEQCIRSTHPQHKVILTQAVYLSACEVTQEQFTAVMLKNPAYFSALGDGKDRVAGLDTKQHPVEKVTWNDAAEFCVKLSELENLPSAYAREGDTFRTLPRNGYRLPTEAEWEFACRAGTTTRHWTGDDEEQLTAVAWFNEPDEGRTHPVGQLAPNPFGLFDIHGNVGEWVQDHWEFEYFQNFVDQPAVDPTGSQNAAGGRVSRDGDWFYTAKDCRSANRYGADPISTPAFAVGFRIALPAAAVRRP